MPTDTKLQNLIINDLTEEQYKALTPNENELYLTPDTSGGEQEIKDLPIVNITDFTTTYTLTDTELINKILDNVNKQREHICIVNVVLQNNSIFFSGIINYDDLLHGESIEGKMFSKIVNINLGLVENTFAFYMTVNNNEITFNFKQYEYATKNQLSLGMFSNNELGLVVDFGDTGEYNGEKITCDTINGKPILHTDTTVNNYTIPTITFED